MDSSERSALLARVERRCEEQPGLYAVGVAGVTALGYFPLIALAVLTLTAVYFCLAALVQGQTVPPLAVVGAVVSLVLMLAVARTLVVRLEPPTGRVVTREEAPKLFALIDDVLERTAVRRKGKVHKFEIASVTLDDSCDINLRQLPRWGVFGEYDNHLSIGIPLLAVLSVAELSTVVAHEIGHLGGEHGRWSAWIYRQRPAWEAVERSLATPANVLERLLAAFYLRYVPYFTAYTLALARNLELQADQRAAWATNAQVLGRALVKKALAERFLNEVYWERFYAHLEKTPEPPYPPYSMLPRAFAVAHKEWLRSDWMYQALRALVADGDTHPQLNERLAALNLQPELPSYSPEATALKALGSLASAMLKWCDEQWRAANREAWRKRHEEIVQARWKIEQYESVPAEELGPQDRWDKSLLLLDVGRQADAIEELRALVILDPNAAKAHFLLGRLLLEAGDESGLHNLTLAAQQDAELLAPAGQLGYGYLIERGRKAEAQRFWERCQAA